MILYLQSNYNGTFAIAEYWGDFIDERGGCYYAILEDISGTTTFIEIYKYVVEKYGCKKLVLDF